MSSINDLKRIALRNLGAPKGNLNDMELFWLRDITKGTERKDYNDQWRDYMINEGVLSEGLNDMHRNFLKSIGNTGEVSADLWRVFWAGGAAVPQIQEITDPLFNSPGQWITGAGWAVSSGSASCDGTQIASTTLSNIGSFSINDALYLVKYDIIAISAGSVSSEIGGVSGAAQTTTGSVSELITATSVSEHSLIGDTDFVGTIDNFSVNEIFSNVPILEYDFLLAAGSAIEDATVLGSDIGLSRATVATYFDESGTLVTAAVDAPRFDHDQITGDRLGLLIEGPAQNGVRNSEADPTGLSVPTNWTTAGSIVSHSVETSFKFIGANEVDIIVSNTSGGPQNLSLDFEGSTIIAAAAAEDWDISFYAKLKSGTFAGTFTIRHRWLNSTPAQISIDLTTVDSPTSDWKLCSKAVNSPANTAWIHPGIRIEGVPDGASFTITLALPQVVQASFPSSRIITTGSAFTRAADIVTVSTFPANFNEAGMTYYLEYINPNVVAGAVTTFLMSVSDGTVNNDHAIAFQTGTAEIPRAFVFDGGVARGDVTSSSINPNIAAKTAISVAENNVSISTDGAAITTDITVSPLPTGLDAVKLGRRGNDGNNFSGHTARFLMWNRAMPSRLQGLAS